MVNLDTLYWEKPVIESGHAENVLTYRRESKWEELQLLRTLTGKKEESEGFKVLKKEREIEFADFEESDICYDKVVCDLNRICEIEDSEDNWYDYQYFRGRELIPINKKIFSPMFNVKKILCAGLDILVTKIYLEAVKEG